VIGRLSGQVAAVSGTRLILDVQGVGYEIEATNGIAHGTAVGKETVVWVRTVVREGAFTLFAFETLQERDLFDTLCKVPGVGPSLGMAAVSNLGCERCVVAVKNEDVLTLRTVPGIGDRLARRIVSDLSRGKALGSVGGGDQPLGVVGELRSALENLGFHPREFESIVARCDPCLDLESALRWALAELRS
jgi:Holliday junction DNA helicase RuvA